MARYDEKQTIPQASSIAERKRRLAEALRANLGKRKQQARQRKDAGSDESPAPAGPAGRLTDDQG